jgi:hypothetical protein
MEDNERLSQQGLREVTESKAKELKQFFASEISSKYGLNPKGYFIGKTLLGKMLIENEDAAGIVISFGLDDAIGKGGKIQLVVEPASGKKKKDTAKIMSKLKKYSTLDTGGPDGGLVSIKPTPPPKP